MKKSRIFDAAIVFIVSVLILLFASPILAQKMGIWGVAIPELLIVMIAIAAILIRKEDVCERLSLSFPKIKSFFGAVLLVLGATAWQNAATMIFVNLTGYTSDTDVTFFERFFDKASPFVMLVVVALIPAICEEIFFRGYLLNSFKTKRSAVPAIIITGVLFAGIHLDLYKFLPLLILGCAYGYIAAKTGSVLLPAIFHFINNALAVISLYTMKNAPQQDITSILTGDNYIGYAIASVGFGLLLIYFGSRILSEKPKSKRTNLTVLITSGAIFTLGVAMLMMNMTYVAYEGGYKAQLNEDTEYTESFTLENEAYASVDASIRSSRAIDCNIVITDTAGAVIYDHEGGSSTILHLYPDEYTVTYTFDIDEDMAFKVDVHASVKLNCLSLTKAPTENSFEAEDTAEITEETEEIIEETEETEEIGIEAL